MTYILSIGPWHVGPFPTHAAATWWAEAHGVDSYDMLQMDDPAEAPARIARLPWRRRWQPASDRTRELLITRTRCAAVDLVL